jgi:outer membrane protein
MNKFLHRATGRVRSGLASLMATLLVSLAFFTPSARAQTPTPPSSQDQATQLQISNSEPLTLKAAVSLAIQNSRDLRIARLQYTIAQNEVNVQKAEFRPNLYTGAGAVYTYGFPETPGGALPSVFKLAYQQDLYNPLVRGQVKAAQDRARNQQLDIDRTRDSIIVQTASAYLELAQVRHSLELLRNESASAQKILEYVRNRAGAGLELPIEVTRGELTAARIEHHLIQLTGRDDALTQKLRDTLGLPDSASIEVLPEQLPDSAEETAAALENTALQDNLDLKQMENERQARQHLFQGARGAYWPTVRLIGEYDVFSSKLNNFDKFYNAHSFQTNNFNFGVEITIPLFAARTPAAAALAKSELSLAEGNVGSKRTEVRLEVRQQAQAVKELDSAREVARLDLKLAQETLDITQNKFNQGQASLRDLEQDRLDESEKWVAFLNADLAKQQAQLNLLQTTGQLAKLFP